jgi:predicted transcriptional regulator
MRTLTLELPDSIASELRKQATTIAESEESLAVKAISAYLAEESELQRELSAWKLVGAEALERVAPIADETW